MPPSSLVLCMRSLAPPWTRPSTPSPSTATPRHAIRCSCSPPAPRRHAGRRISACRTIRGPRASAGPPSIGLPHDPRLAGFRAALTEVLLDLAHQVVKDGEGATKFVMVRVTGADTAQAARRIAFAIANSPLVKTAIAGEDPNWGRVVMAVGKAGEPANRDRVAICFGDTRVAVRGERDPAYSEETASQYMKRPEIVIAVDVGVGPASDTVWTCDLTHEYISINADYRS